MDDLKENVYFCLLGGLFGTLQGLEFAIRAFLHDNSDPSEVRLAKGDNLNNLHVGDQRKVNAMTCSDSLGPLIDRYNGLVPKERQVNRNIVDIRDALAHGRVFNKDAAGWFHLLKFSRKQNEKGMVTVEFSQELTAEWLRAQAVRASSELKKVIASQNEKSNG